MGALGPWCIKLFRHMINIWGLQGPILAFLSGPVGMHQKQR
jgi:hypothetical protein